MSLFRIDEKKCKRDGMCARECPAQIIAFTGKDTVPVPIADAEEFCINCGHCVAVCPHDALTLETMPQTYCPPLQKDLLPGPEAIQHFLQARRSIRQYKKKPADHKLLENLIDTARYAPTGSNKQEVHWMIVEDSDEVNRLAGLVVDFIKEALPLSVDEDYKKRMRRIIAAWDDGKDRILRGAPHLILVHSQADLPFAEADCVIALTYLELYAYAQGLGTCWAGYFTAAANIHQPLLDTLGLPEGHRCFGAVMLGYPQFSYAKIPARNAAQTTWR